MKTLGVMVTVIAVALMTMFVLWCNDYEENHNLVDAAQMYYHVELKGENQYLYLANQFMDELTDSTFS